MEKLQNILVRTCILCMIILKQTTQVIAQGNGNKLNQNGKNILLTLTQTYSYIFWQCYLGTECSI